VELIFSTGHYSSTVRKSATILSNATGVVPRLTIAADVRKAMDSLDVFQVTPTLVDMDKQRPEEQKHAWEYELGLKNLSDKGLSFSIVSKPEEYLSIDFPEGKTIDPGEEKSFKIKVDPKVSEELYTKSLTIEASDEAHTRMTIPIMKSMRWGPTTQK